MALLDFLSPSTDFGSALQQLGQRDLGYRQDQHMNKVFAANPAFAQSIYRAKNDQTESALRALKMQNGSDLPSAIQEYEYYMKLPEAERKKYLEVKRQQQWLNAGGEFVNPTAGTSISKTLAPENLPSTRAAQQEAVKSVDLAVDPLITAANKSATIKSTSQAEAEVGLPDKLATADRTLNLIDEMIGNKEKGISEHPGLSGAVGPLSSKLPTLTDNTADFESYLEQVKGSAFLESVQSLQGYGALSNEEGAKATQAATRMQTATSEKGFIKAAEDYRKWVEIGKERLQKKAGKPALPSDIPEGAVQVGTANGKPVYKLPDGRGWTP